MIDSLIVLGKTVLSLGGLAGFVAMQIAVGIWVFRPVDQAAKDREHPTQFTIIDFFCLIFVIQVSMAVVHWLLGSRRDDEMAIVYIFDVFSWFACCTLWMKSVQLMSRAGIERPLHRVFFLAFIIPGTLVSSMGLPVVLLFILGIVFGDPDIEAYFDLLGLLIVLCFMPPVLYVSAKSTRRIVAAAEPPPLAFVDVEIVEESGVS